MLFLTQYGILSPGLYVQKNLRVGFNKTAWRTLENSSPERTANIQKGLPSFLARKSGGECSGAVYSSYVKKDGGEGEKLKLIMLLIFL